jgi:Tfp pilus assembly protein FimT
MSRYYSGRVGSQFAINRCWIFVSACIGVFVKRLARYKRGSEAGFSILEMLAAMLLSLILIGTALVNLKTLNNPLLNASAQVQSFLKKVRSRAISSTMAYRITPISSTELVTAYGSNCDNIDTEDNQLTLELPNGAYLTDYEWEICFSTRGLLDTNVDITLEDQNGQSRLIEVLLGGSVREL